MSMYFKPLRRKFGVAALMVACLFVTGWIRSSTTQDVITFGVDSVYRFKLVSASNRFGLAMIRIDSDDWIPFRVWTSDPAVSNHWGVSLAPGVPTISNSIDGRFLIVSNGHVEYLNTRIRGDWCHIPYWSIVIPLTLLSGGLLLSAPETNPMEKPISRI